MFAHDEVFEEAFRREAHRAAKFRHPSIIAIHYAGKEGDIVFFSMDLLEQGLKDLIQQGPADEGTIIKVGMDVSSALQFAHTYEGGVVHRDLKPDNIRFDRHGNAVVTDFGIAQVATNYSEATGTTITVGTPRYMSPEQARGWRVDHRSDIYSLGITLYEMAAGRTPFSGADWFELGRKHIEEPPAPLRELNPAINPGLERVILRCLEKDPDDRYQSAQEVAGALAETAAGGAATVVVGAGAATVPLPRTEPARDRRPAAAERPAATLGERAGAGWRSRPKLYAGVAAGVAALLALGGYRLDVLGARRQAESALPALAGLPLLGSGRIYVGEPTTVTVEGGADVNSVITLPFTGPIDPRTATSANVQMLAPDSSPVPAQVRVAENRRAIEIDPDNALEFGTEYTVVVRAGLLSAGGGPVMASPAATEPGARFTLATSPPPADYEPPRVASSQPRNGARNVPPAAPLTLTFSEAVNPATVDSASVQLLDPRGRAVPVQVVCCMNSLRTAEVRPAAALRPNAAYLLRLAPTIADRAGNRMAADSVAFRTGAVTAAAVPAEAGGAGAAEPTGPAFLSIRVTPDEFAPYVRVSVDGEELRQPPTGDVEVDPGKSHLVEIFGVPEFSMDRLPLYRQQHRATPGQSTEIVARLAPFGSISVNSQPSGLVFVDGREIRATPVAGYPVRAGVRHTLEIRPVGEEAERYAPYEAEFQVRPLEWKALGNVRLLPR